MSRKRWDALIKFNKLKNYSIINFIILLKILDKSSPMSLY